MSDLMHYRFLNHIDAPKRLLALTLDELSVVALALVLLIASSQKVMVALFGFGLLSALKFLKGGQNPKFLLILAYWYLPGSLTSFFLPKLPKSHYRIWKA